MPGDFRRLVAEMRDAYFLIQDASIMVLSGSELTKLGYEEKDFAGIPFTQIFPPELNKELLEKYDSLLAGNMTLDRLHTDLALEDGARIPVEVSIWPTWYQGKPAVAGIVLDMSSRLATEQALRESEEKLRVMLESISEGIAVIDLESNIQDMNPAMLSLYGYDHREEVLGMSAFEFIPPEYREAAVANQRKTLRDGYSGNLEIMLVNRNGKRYEAEISAAPLRDKAGEPVGFIAITRNITERKRQEAENLRLQATLRFYSSQVVKASKELVQAIRGIDSQSSHNIVVGRGLSGLESSGEEVELLTPREIQVLRLAARGLSNKDIGSELGITVRTVKGHLLNIYTKMKVKSRTESVARALKEGWITLDDMGPVN